jgi:ElaA protein
MSERKVDERNRTWLWLPFAELSVKQLHAALQLRQRVFVVEQQCAYLDADDIDASCWHGLCFESETLLATARIVPPGLVYDTPAIGRVVTAATVRGTGVGRELMSEAIACTKRLYPGQGITLSAQLYLLKFYESFHFARMGAPYEEDGIPHVQMHRAA